jgi:hypothetical protein
MAIDPENDQPSSIEEPAKPGPTLGTRLLRYTILVLILLALGIYIWKELAIQSLELKMEDQQTEMAKEQQEALDAQTRTMLQLTALPLAWAVRKEMMGGNLSQVDSYFRDFVRQEGVLSIFLIDQENKVALATNKKLETQPADQVISRAIQDAESVLIEKSDSVFRMGVPIMSFNEKLGILVVDYEPQPKSKE